MESTGFPVSVVLRHGPDYTLISAGADNAAALHLGEHLAGGEMHCGGFQGR